MTRQSEIVYRYLAAHAHAPKVQLVGPLASPATVLTEPMIFVDGGTRLRVQGEGVSVGDGDSFDGFLDHRLDPNKDLSDLAYVLRHIGLEFNEIELCGFLGGRRDHELLNLGEVHHFLGRRHVSARVLFDQQVVAYSQGQWQFESYGTFSLVVFSPCHVTLSGDCRYPILPEGAVPPLRSFGLSNVGHGKIELKTDGPVFIFYA